jgi:hypothetical protein
MYIILKVSGKIRMSFIPSNAMPGIHMTLLTCSFMLYHQTVGVYTSTGLVPWLRNASLYHPLYYHVINWNSY